MRNFLKLIIFFLGYCCYAQTDVVIFDYDPLSGTQITRELICISCDDPMRQASRTMSSEEEYTTSADHYQISYYPNPVLEELSLRWDNSEVSYVTSIEVYSLYGQRVRFVNNLEAKTEAKVNFQDLAVGVYTLKLIYSNQGNKDLKIIKK